MISFFSGGVSPLPTQRPLEHGFWNAAVPTLCVVPLQQHAGSKLYPRVKTRDTVREGMVIAEGESSLSVPIHAPIPGRVATTGTTTLLDGSRAPAIAIELAGEFDRLGKDPEPQTWTNLTTDELLGIIRNAGIVCSPRSGVPAHVHLKRGVQSEPPVAVLDVAETEPYLSADAEIAAERPQEVLEGLHIVARILNTERLHAVVATKFSRAYKALRRTGERGSLLVHRVPHRYPANSEHNLRRAVGLRAGDDQIDLVAVAPATVLAIRDAVLFGKPQIDRVISVGGGAVRRPAHVRVRLGMSIADVLQECGGLTVEPERIIAGGTLTGQIVRNVNAPITKSVSAIVALTADEVHGGEEEPCIGCGGCVRACPVSLNPMLLNDLILDGRNDELRDAGVFDCTECGLCAHVCPSRIPLVERIREGKKRVSDEEGA